MGVSASGASATRAPRSFLGALAHSSYDVAATLMVILAACLVAYWPGLHGSFLFDDYANLNALGAYGGVHNLSSALQFIFGGIAGPTGRPISMASFLIDATNWPTSPFPFKYDNLLFHLITGMLLAWLALKLAQALKLPPRRAAWVSVLTAGLWMLHPFFVSTVLFDVQRMAILAALFVATGLALYASGRLNLTEGRTKAGFIKTSIGVGLFTPLAFFSKENGALLPLLAFTIECTVLTASPLPEHLKRKFGLWKALFIYLPLLAMALHFAIHWQGVLDGYHYRRFTFSQRLLTEPRVLMNYLYHLLIPRMQTSGLYHDNYTLSSGLLHPFTTLPSILALTGALAAALIWRRRYPVLSLAILFFLAGQILESSFIPLDIYFEHRNYLPAMMLFFALGYYLVRYAGQTPRLAVPLTVMLLAGLTGLTYARSSLWGNLDELSLVWAQQNPSSRRAQQQAAIVWSQRGQPRRALAHIETALHYQPHAPVLNLQALMLHCGISPVKKGALVRTEHWLSKGHYSDYVYRNLQRVINLKKQGECAPIRTQQLFDLDQALLTNHAVKNQGSAHQRILYAQGQLLLMQDKKSQAEAAINQAFQAEPTVASAMQLTGLLATNGDYDAALRMLQNAKFILQHAQRSLNPITRLSIDAQHYPKEIARVRKNILQAKAKEDKNSR